MSHSLKEFAVVSETTGEVLCRYLEDRKVKLIPQFRHLKYAVIQEGVQLREDVVFLSCTTKYLKAVREAGNEKYAVDSIGKNASHQIIMILQNWEVEPNPIKVE